MRTPYGPVRASIDPDSFVDGFGTWSGTSFATPILAARLASRLLEADAKAERQGGGAGRGGLRRRGQPDVGRGDRRARSGSPDGVNVAVQDRAARLHDLAVDAAAGGRFVTASRLSRKGLDVAEPGSELRARTLLTYAWAEAEQARVESSLALLDEAEQVARAHPGIAGLTFGQRGVLLLRLGQAQRAARRPHPRRRPARRPSPWSRPGPA